MLEIGSSGFFLVCSEGFWNVLPGLRLGLFSCTSLFVCVCVSVCLFVCLSAFRACHLRPRTENPELLLKPGA